MQNLTYLDVKMALGYDVYNNNSADYTKGSDARVQGACCMCGQTHCDWFMGEVSWHNIW